MKKEILTILALVSVSCAPDKIVVKKTEHLEAKLISEVTSIGLGQPFWVGLALDMEEGWHINWKNPGDAGLAPSIKWELPEGFKADEISWPIPARINVPPFVLFGYEDKVLLPVRITPCQDLSELKKVQIKADCDWIVCAEACIPGSAHLELNLEISSLSAEIDSRWSGEFESARANSSTFNEFLHTNAIATENLLILSVVPISGDHPTIENLIFFPDEQGIIENSAEQVITRIDNGYQIEIKRDKMIQKLPDTLTGIIVAKSNGWSPAARGVEVSIPLLKKART